MCNLMIQQWKSKGHWDVGQRNYFSFHNQCQEGISKVIQGLLKSMPSPWILNKWEFESLGFRIVIVWRKTKSHSIIIVVLRLFLLTIGDCISILLIVFLYTCNIVMSIDNEKRRLQFHARLAHIGWTRVKSLCWSYYVFEIASLWFILCNFKFICNFVWSHNG